MQFSPSALVLATSIAISVTVSGQTNPRIADLELLDARGRASGGGSASQAVSGACTPGWASTFGPVGNPDVEHPVYVATAFGSGAARRWVVSRVRTNASGAWGTFIDAWDGSGWTTLGEVTGTLMPQVMMLQALDDGSGERLYAGGNFTAIGGVAANGIAVHDGIGWSALGSGLDNSGFNSSAQCAALFDAGQGPVLIVGGAFTSAGGVQARNIASWDGATWSPLVGGDIPGARVTALAVDESGPAPVLYAGGTFTTAGGVVCNSVAQWNGSAWSNLGPGLVNFVFQGEVNDFALFDEGQGPRLFAIGLFDVPTTASPPIPDSGIARWDGTSWSSVGDASFVTGVGSRRLLVHDDGTGSELYAGGSIYMSGGLPLRGVTRWDGVTWEALPGAPFDGVASLSLFDPGDGLAIMCTGTFVDSPAGDAFVTRWRGCPAPIGMAYCTPAIANSTGQAGLIGATGSSVVAVNSVSLEASQLPTSSFGYFLTSRNQGNAFPVGNSQGRFCLGGFIGRFNGPGQVQSSGTTGTFSLALDLSSMPQPSGSVAVQPGETWHFQAWFRDANPSSTSNFTDAVSVTFL